MRLIDADAFVREVVKLDDLRRLSTKTIGEALDRCHRRGRCGGGAVQGVRVCVESHDDRNSVLRAVRKESIYCAS